MKARLSFLVPGLTLLASTALAAISIGAHQSQVAVCRANAARARAASDDKTRSEAAPREEECLVQANDAVLPTLSRAAGEAVDVPNAAQTHRDSSASLCSVLSEKSAQVEGSGHPFAKAQCVADRESELARLIDEYAAGGQPPGTVTTGYAACDDAFKAGRKADEAGAWTTLASCGSDELNAKVPLLVPKVADGDPLALLSHPPEQIAMTLRATIAAGNDVCEALAATVGGAAGQPNPQKTLVRLRCRAEVVANVSRAVNDRLH